MLESLALRLEVVFLVDLVSELLFPLGAFAFVVQQ